MHLRANGKLRQIFYSSAKIIQIIPGLVPVIPFWDSSFHSSTLYLPKYAYNPPKTMDFDALLEDYKGLNEGFF